MNGYRLVVCLLVALWLDQAVLAEEACGSGPRKCPVIKKGNCRYRPYDGSCSSPKNPRCGSAQSLYARLVPSKTYGRHQFPLMSSGKEFPNARLLSRTLFPVGETFDPNITLEVMQYGQLITHDVGFTSINQKSPLSCASDDMHFIPQPKTYECASINVTGDSYYLKYNATCVSMYRTSTNTKYNCSLWTTHEEQLSQVTAPLDLHIIYGMSEDSAKSLRTLQNGLLRTATRNGQEWLPDSPKNLTSRFCYSVINPKLCYISGDPRVNQNTHLMVLEILFLRQHNRIARILAKINTHWDDERLFQEARRINIAIHQHISYYEMLKYYLPIKYLYENRILYNTTGYVNDYNENVCPAALNEFSHGAFRHPHSMIVDKLKLYSNNRTLEGTISLKDYYNDPVPVEKNFDALTIGLHTQPSGAADITYVFQIKNQFAPKYKESGLDLRAIDIQRGRDHGLPSYNTMRAYCGFKRATRFEDFADHIEKSRIIKLQEHYDDVEDVELVVGVSYETSVPGALGGPLFVCILRIQFYRTRVGDPFWYEREECGFTLEQLGEIRKATMALVTCDNGNNITSMQRRAFATISESNPVVPCSEIPKLNYNMWKEEPPK